MKSRKTTIRNAKEFYKFCKANRKEIEDRNSACNADSGKEKKRVHFQKFFLVEDIDRSMKLTAVGTHNTLQFHQVRSTGNPLIMQFREVGYLCPSCLQGNGSAYPNQGYTQNWKTINLHFGKKYCDKAFVNTYWGPDRQADIQNQEQLSSDFSWDCLYSRISDCTSFEDLSHMVYMTTLPEVQHQPLPVWQQGISNNDGIDQVARTELMMLTDTDHIGAGILVTTVADGNCLPHAASKLMFGTKENHLEVRMQLVFEAVKNENQYLSKTYLLEGASQRTCGTPLTQMYAMYSGHYTGITGFSCMEKAIQEAFRTDVMGICKIGTYMGMFQMFALSNVMQRPIHSVFPQRGKQQFHDDFHRAILPLHKPFRKRNSAVIMWTPMNVGGHIVHFVPILRSKKNLCLSLYLEVVTHFCFLFSFLACCS